MRTAFTARGFLAVLLLAALVLLGSPSPASAGGCDDPGNIGACNNKPNSSSHLHPSPPGPPPAPHIQRGHVVAPSPKIDVFGWRSWLLTLLSGLIR